MVSWQELEDYKRNMRILEDRVNHDLSVAYSKVMRLTPEQIRDALVELVPALIDKYGSIAAAMAADWFEQLTELKAVVPDLYQPQGWQANTRWALSPLFDGTQDLRSAFVHLVEVSKREVKNHGRSTIAHSVRQYSNVLYARVMTGPSNCSFCVVLSSRGPVYGSAQTAKIDQEGEKYHANCDCVAVPMRGQWAHDDGSARGMTWQGDRVAGYDFDDLYRREYAPFHADNDTINDVVSKRDKAFRAWQKEEETKNGKYDRRGGSSDHPTFQKAQWEAFRDRADKRYDELAVDKWAEAKPLPRRFVEVPIPWDESIPELSTRQWNHILYGYSNGGGHLYGYGWVSGGTEFEKGFSPVDIATSLKSILQTKNVDDWVGTKDVKINGHHYRINCAMSGGRVFVNTFHPVEKGRR